MKKQITFTLLLLLLTTLLTLCACDKDGGINNDNNALTNNEILGAQVVPETNFALAEEHLKNAGYSTVRIVENFAQSSLNASYPSDSAKADYISITIFENEKIAQLTYQTYKENYQHEINNLKNGIAVYEELLTLYKAEMSEDEALSIEKEIEDMKYELNYITEYCSYGISKNIVWHGTLGGVNATK